MKELIFDIDGRPFCPRCGAKMARGGKGQSGLKWYKQYRCAKISGCGYKCLDYNEPVQIEKSCIDK